VRDWDFDGLLVRTLKISCFILAFLCAALILRPKDPMIWGFLIGVAAGMWNAFFLSRRLHAIVGLAAPQANARMKGGFFMRLSIVIAVLFFVFQTGWISLLATAAGMIAVSCIFTCGALCVCLGQAEKTERQNL